MSKRKRNYNVEFKKKAVESSWIITLAQGNLK